METSKRKTGGSLEASLFHIIHEHQNKALLIRDQTEAVFLSLCQCDTNFIQNSENQALMSTKQISAVTFSVPVCYRAKKGAMKSAQKLSNLLVDTVNGGIEEAFVNEKRIEMEIRALLLTISRYKKQTDQWLSTTHALNTVLKEIGDFENWMKVMEFDCKSINAAIQNIHQV